MKIFLKIITFVGAILLGAVAMYALIYFFPQEFSTTVTKTEKDVTVTDEGISDAVEKVYDSVVVVSNYNNNALVSTGTGFVYQVEGDKAYILTNAHVIEGGNKVTVTLTNGKVIETEVIGANSLDDIAVLTIDADEAIQIAQLGSSEEMKVGDTTFAVGAPLDDAFSWTVTRGIVSGKDRLVEVEASNPSDPSYIMNVMQTDAAINSGNSGGPLCNSNGEIIGITTLKLSSTGVEGMGFAIPIEKAIEISEEIISGEIKTQPYIGVSMIDFGAAYVNSTYYTFQDVIEKSNLDSGVVIIEVEENSAASSAGIQKGDIIESINGKSIDSITHFKYELYTYEVGDTVTFSIIRDGKKVNVEITLRSNNSSL